MEGAPLPAPAQGQTPAAPAPDPMANAGGAMPAPDPMAGGDAMGEMPEGDPMSGDEAGMEGDDSTEGIISQLSDDDKEAVRNYAKSLLNRDETASEEDTDMEGEMPAEEPNAAVPAPAAQPQAPAAPIQEGVMLQMSKGRLKRAQKMLSEKFRDADDVERKPGARQEMVKKPNKRSPFSNPWN